MILLGCIHKVPCGPIVIGFGRPRPRGFCRVLSFIKSVGGALSRPAGHPGPPGSIADQSSLSTSGRDRSTLSRSLASVIQLLAGPGTQPNVNFASVRTRLRVKGCPRNYVTSTPRVLRLTITMFREHEVLPWRRHAAQVSTRPPETIALSGDVERLVAGPDRMWRLRDGHPRLPLSFSLRARKEA